MTIVICAVRWRNTALIIKYWSRYCIIMRIYCTYVFLCHQLRLNVRLFLKKWYQHGWKHTCNFQQSVCQSAFAMVNVCNNAKIPDFVHRKLGEVNGFLKKMAATHKFAVFHFSHIHENLFNQIHCTQIFLCTLYSMCLFLTVKELSDKYDWV